MASIRLRGLLYSTDDRQPVAVSLRGLPATILDADLVELKEDFLIPHLVKRSSLPTDSSKASANPDDYEIVALEEQPAPTYDDDALSTLRDAFRRRLSVAQSLRTIGSLFQDGINKNGVQFIAFYRFDSKQQPAKVAEVSMAATQSVTESTPQSSPEKNFSFFDSLAAYEPPQPQPSVMEQIVRSLPPEFSRIFASPEQPVHVNSHIASTYEMEMKLPSNDALHEKIPEDRRQETVDERMPTPSGPISSQDQLEQVPFDDEAVDEDNEVDTGLNCEEPGNNECAVPVLDEHMAVVAPLLLHHADNLSDEIVDSVHTGLVTPSKSKSPVAETAPNTVPSTNQTTGGSSLNAHQNNVPVKTESPIQAGSSAIANVVDLTLLSSDSEDDIRIISERPISPLQSFVHAAPDCAASGAFANDGAVTTHHKATPKKKRTNSNGHRVQLDTVWPPASKPKRKRKATSEYTGRLKRARYVDVPQPTQRDAYNTSDGEDDTPAPRSFPSKQRTVSSPLSEAPLSQDDSSSGEEGRTPAPVALERKRQQNLAAYRQHNAIRSAVPRRELAEPSTAKVDAPQPSLEDTVLYYRIGGATCDCCSNLYDLDTLLPSRRAPHHLDLILHDLEAYQLPSVAKLGAKIDLSKMTTLTLRGCRFSYEQYGSAHSIQEYSDWLNEVAKTGNALLSLTLMHLRSSEAKMKPLPAMLEMLYVRHCDTTTTDLRSLLFNSRYTLKTLVVCLWKKFRAKDLVEVLRDFGGNITEIMIDLYQPEDDQQFMAQAKNIYGYLPMVRISTVQFSSKNRNGANELLLQDMSESVAAVSLEEIHLSTLDRSRLAATAQYLKPDNFPHLQTFASDILRSPCQEVLAFKAMLCTGAYKVNFADEISVLI